jgi:3-hydroxy-9,10-secoandrosta-1,3,5(10)-triene-9,17-dione monooxygenase reductase component
MAHAQVIDPDGYRAVMGRFVTGVTVVTTLDDGTTAGPAPTAGPATPPGPATTPQPFGTTVNSFTSVSLDPPLVLITIGRERSIHPVLAKAGRFAVNILAEGSQGLSDCFAGAPSPIPRSAFCGAAWHPSPAGLPFLDAALAWVDCDLERIIEAGDHTIYLGRVTALEASDSNAWPLLYFQRRYLRIEHAAAADLRGKPDKT